MSRATHPLARWPLWKASAVAMFSFGLFGLVIGFFPGYSPVALSAGATLAALGVGASLWNWKTFSWHARFLTAVAWSLMLLLIAARSWMTLVTPPWLVAVPLVGVYLLSWALPIVAPATADFLWREQTTPETRVGRVILGLTVGVAPMAAALGASIGMFGHRLGDRDLVVLVAGILGLIATYAVSFAFSFQLRP